MDEQRKARIEDLTLENRSLIADLAAARAEIERLNGRRCDGCGHRINGGSISPGPGKILCNIKLIVYESDHYCKQWESKEDEVERRR